MAKTPHSHARQRGIIEVCLNFAPFVGMGASLGLAILSTEDVKPWITALCVIGFMAGLHGYGVVVDVLLSDRFREPWFFVCGLVLSFVWSFGMFPCGLVAGVPLFVIFMKHRLEFQPSHRYLP